MKFKLLLICIFTVLLTGIHAQSNDYIQLKDGSIIKGEIIEVITDQHIKIKTVEGNVLKYALSDVKKSKIKGVGNVSSVKLKSKGYYNYTNIGLLMGRNNYSNASVNFQMVNGFQFKNKYQIGIGTGINQFDGSPLLPVYLDARYLFRDTEVTPFVELLGGYSFNLGGETNYYPMYSSYYAPAPVNGGGITSGLQFGVRNYVKENFGFTISGGYLFQRTNRSYMDTWWNGAEYVYNEVLERKYHHRFEIKLGILFN